MITCEGLLRIEFNIYVGIAVKFVETRLNLSLNHTEMNIYKTH